MNSNFGAFAASPPSSIHLALKSLAPFSSKSLPLSLSHSHAQRQRQRERGYMDMDIDTDLDIDEELLEFELESRFASPTTNTKKRKKVIDLDDLLSDCKKEEERQKKSNSKIARVHKNVSSVFDDEDKTERKLSEAVDEFHNLIKEIDGNDNA